MRFSRAVILVISCALVVVGCKAAATCVSAVSCGSGKSYQACTDGSQCWLDASDATRFDCNGCGDCGDATAKVVSWCGGVGGNGNSGGSDAGSNGSPGAPGSQAQVCADYLACAAQFAPSEFPSLVSTYGPSGSCWQSTAALATSCASACQSSLAGAAADPSSPAVCHTNVPPNDMATPPLGGSRILVVGDAASAYSGDGIITAVSCAAQSNGQLLVEAALPNNFPSGSTLGAKTLVLAILDSGLGVVDPTTNTIWYQHLGQIAVPSAGSVPVTTLASAMTGATGTLTVSGGWRCP